MKNKNKSKAVQKYIKSITQNATGKSSKTEDAERKAKEDKQAAIKQSALMASLFNMQTDKKGRTFDPVAKKKAKQEEEEALAAGKKLKDEVKKEIIEGIANTIRLTNAKGVRMSELGGHQIIHALKEKHADTWKTLSLLLFIKAQPKVFWVDDPEENNPTIRCQEDVDAEEGPDERPLEEIIEEKRRNLPPGGTPVTKESFFAWKEKREQDRLAAVEEARKDRMKKGNKTGNTGLSGKDLFTFDASLFVDDAEAVSADEYEERNEDANYDDEPGKKTKEKTQEEDEDEDDDEEEGETDGAAAAGSSVARGSTDPPAEGEQVAINSELFLEGDDLPEDLDDLDDVDDDEAATKD
jgi:hypothetical protein